MMLFGEAGLRQAVTSYIEHYHAERAHQGLGNEAIEAVEPGQENVRRSERLGGILKHDDRAA